ncbi:phosphatidylglycerophosphatase A [Thermoanaerobacter mathranii subsp. mathranii str. A3]|uniref:Phosphatidylglycerophosphatase A n=1 Tax=Thermoanaerobacter mathranii subsp. mathranii (strain DSM 11426 / CCUG 53645 / CIP 108742 / A3) TaxID=583358 RepID=A0ABM5LPE0_THEM3|nr:phosphatidylglycerophosphatase A [Thermoanaerobacter mathranii]ADH60644.1 phosphatidylglycerophosphatase A [Thermoanaerobacter mathranii subsp. mathranii str. A3]
MKDIAINLLEERGVTLEDMTVLVLDLQKRYYDDLTIEECIENLHHVLEKREVQNAILTGIALDKLAEKDMLEEPLLSIIKRDEPLYGIDEILALSITNIYGSIGFTNFGYLDKVKPGIMGNLNKDKDKKCNTFIDDLVAAIIAAACARIAHSRKEVL